MERRELGSTNTLKMKTQAWVCTLLALLGFFFPLVGCPAYLTPDPNTPDQGLHRTTGGDVYHWGHDQIPITVYIDQRIPIFYREEILRAAEEWNTRLGMNVLDVYEEEGPREVFLSPPYASISVSIGRLGRNSRGIIRGMAYAKLMSEQTRFAPFYPGRIHSCTIFLAHNVDISEVYFVSTHEFGHCFGLEHDELRTSLMYYHATDNHDQVVTHWDIERIRSYLPSRD